MLIDDLPPPTIQQPPNQADAPPHLPMEERADGTLVINLLPLAPVPNECALEEPDPFNPEIIVCRATSPSPRIGPEMLPEVDGFGTAIPRARIKLSDTVAAEGNVINKGVGGWNATGGEVRLKIDF
ncbi:hypothetical protein [Erythrobacter sp.]|uniref:hypothetical protein n=1 Tax=Erythrobacter sp. TaxID=1042 RepID=UPI0025D3ABAE|nr:hypothetical protein [Erythrobacter sp.]